MSTNTQGNYRIRNSHGDTASVWTISNFLSTVAWDEAPQNAEIYNSWDIEKHFKTGHWEKIDNSLPRSFKYYHIDEGPEYVNTWHDDGTTVSWEGTEYSYWGADEAKSFIKRGIWIVLPSEPKKTTLHISSSIPKSIDVKGFESLTWEQVGVVDSTANNLLDTIKDFTSGKGHEVFISEGIYKVYRKGEDSPYLCETDEQVIAVIDALITLDSMETE